MSRIATVKETGVELSQEEWARFDEAVATTLHERGEPWPFNRSTGHSDGASSLSSFVSEASGPRLSRFRDREHG